jgi:hypothetical protein
MRAVASGVSVHRDRPVVLTDKALVPSPYVVQISLKPDERHFLGSDKRLYIVRESKEPELSQVVTNGCLTSEIEALRRTHYEQKRGYRASLHAQIERAAALFEGLMVDDGEKQFFLNSQAILGMRKSKSADLLMTVFQRVFGSDRNIGKDGSLYLRAARYCLDQGPANEIVATLTSVGGIREAASKWAAVTRPTSSSQHHKSSPRASEKSIEAGRSQAPDVEKADNPNQHSRRKVGPQPEIWNSTLQIENGAEVFRSLPTNGRCELSVEVRGFDRNSVELVVFAVKPYR